MKVFRKDKWIDVPVEELEGKSLCSYVADSFEPVCGAVFPTPEAEKPFMFVVNTPKVYAEMCERAERMEPKAYTFMASDVQEFLGTEIVPQVVANVFPDGTLSVKKKEPEKDDA